MYHHTPVRTIAALPFALILLLPVQAQACATCGCTLSKDWIGPQEGSVSGWSVGLSYDFINQNRYRAGSHAIDFNGAEARLNPTGTEASEVELQTATRTYTVQVDYVQDDWGLSLQAPLVDRYHTTFQEGTPDSYNFNTFRTLGDVRMSGKYTGWSADGSSGVTLGFKLPTGSTNESFGGPAGGTVDPALQPGTGSTDVLLGAFVSGMQSKIGWFAQGTWQHAISIKNGYRPGDSVTATAGLRYGDMTQAVVPLLQFNYTHRDIDTGEGVNVSNVDGSPVTGGDLLYVAPGVSARLGEGFSAYAYVQVPIYQFVKGVQLTPAYILSLGVRKTF